MEDRPEIQGVVKAKPHFFDLPQEVRDMIYAYFPFLASIHINLDPSVVSQPNISKTCRRMRRECLDVFYSRNNFFLDVRGWKDASYPRQWTPGMIFERWITAIGDENAARLRSLSFFSHNHFRVNVKISKEKPLSLVLRFRTDRTRAEVAEGAPVSYNFDTAAERAEKAFRRLLDDIEGKTRDGRMTVDDILTISNTVNTIQPFLCRRMNLGFQGALLLKDDTAISDWPDTEAHLDRSEMVARLTRSRSRQQPEVRDNEATSRTTFTPALILRNMPNAPHVKLLPDPLPRTQTNLRSKDFQLLQLKQRKLRDAEGQIPLFIQQLGSVPRTRDSSAVARINPIAQAASATLVFAQEEAGTAMCISSTGLLLTCSHCVADSQEEFESREDKWLLFSSGQVVRAKGLFRDETRDLALLQIIAAQATPDPAAQDITTVDSVHPEPSPSISIAESDPKPKTPIFCIGHPGSEDLEASTVGIATGYDVLHISSGHFRGLAADQDPQDNSEIGALMHDAWTYWGHSGAPLIERKTGRLIGLHSSWDDDTGMRRGVPLIGIRAFLDEHVSMDVRS